MRWVPLILLVLGCQQRGTGFRTSVAVTAPGSGTEYGAELFPMSEGASWTWMSPEGWVELRAEGAGAEIWDRQVQVLSLLDEEARIDTYWRDDGEALWYHGGSQRVYPGGIPLLHYPLRDGKRWSFSCKDGDLQGESEVLGVEAVGTALGVLEAVVVNTVARSPSWDREVMEDTVWYAPGVGIVMRTGHETFRSEQDDFRLLGEPPGWFMRSYQWRIRATEGVHQ
jgi:hypothetical protein